MGRAASANVRNDCPCGAWWVHPTQCSQHGCMPRRCCLCGRRVCGRPQHCWNMSPHRRSRLRAAMGMRGLNFTAMMRVCGIYLHPEAVWTPSTVLRCKLDIRCVCGVAHHCTRVCPLASAWCWHWSPAAGCETCVPGMSAAEAACEIASACSISGNCASPCCRMDHLARAGILVTVLPPTTLTYVQICICSTCNTS